MKKILLKLLSILITSTLIYSDLLANRGLSGRASDHEGSGGGPLGTFGMLIILLVVLDLTSNKNKNNH